VNIWEILGVDVTDDPTVIMSAYARKLKVCHPEDDPDGFQRLRTAYENALKFAKAKVGFADTDEKKEASKEQIRQRDVQVYHILPLFPAPDFPEECARPSDRDTSTCCAAPWHHPPQQKPPAQPTRRRDNPPP